MKTSDPPGFSAVVLAAGFSARMGSPKLALAYDAKRSFVEQCARVFSGFGCTEVAIVVNTSGVEWIQGNRISLPPRSFLAVNPQAHSGRFSSLQTGLSALKDTQRVFVHNVDNPFVKAGVLQVLAQKAGAADCINPVYLGRLGHPVLIGQHPAREILSCGSRDLHLREVLDNYSNLMVSVDDPGILANINSPADVLRWFGQGQG